MSKWEGLNRRQFPRAQYPCLVVIRNSDSDKDVFLTQTENVGIGGICVTLKEDIKMFAPVELEIDLMDLGEHIQCQGKIVWNVQRKEDVQDKPSFYDLGIEYVDLKDEDVKRIEVIVDHLIKQNKGVPYRP